MDEKISLHNSQGKNSTKLTAINGAKLNITASTTRNTPFAL